MSFLLVLKSMNLNDLERRNGCYFALFQLNSAALGPITSKWLKIEPSVKSDNLIITVRYLANGAT